MALAKCWGPRMLRAPWGCHGGGLGDRKLRRLGEEDMNPAVPISQTALSRARRQPPFVVQEAGGVCSPAVGTLAVPSVVNPIPWPLVGLEMLGWAAPSPGGCACCDRGPQADPACGAASQCPPGTWLPAPPPLPPAWHRAAVQNSSPFVPAEAPAPQLLPLGVQDPLPALFPDARSPWQLSHGDSAFRACQPGRDGKGSSGDAPAEVPFVCVSLCGSPGTHGTARAAGCGC